MYLVSRDTALPFTVDDIRADLGLTGRQVDTSIEVGIGYICAMAQRPVVRSVWAIAEGTQPGVYGDIIAIGELHQLDPEKYTDRRWFREYTFEPTTEAIAKARARVIAWCKRQKEIDRAILAEAARYEADERRVPAARAAA